MLGWGGNFEGQGAVLKGASEARIKETNRGVGPRVRGAIDDVTLGKVENLGQSQIL